MAEPIKKEISQTFSRKRLGELEQGASNALNRGRSMAYNATLVLRKRFPKKVPGNGENDLNLVDEKSYIDTLGPVEDLYTEMEKMWNKPMEDSPVFKDIPRLIRRVKVYGISRKHVLFDATKENLPMGAVATAELIVKLLHAIAEKVETDEVRDTVYKATEEHQKKVADDGEDMAGFTMDLCTDIGLETKTMKVLRCLHQNVVLQSTLKLKMLVTKGFMTMDVKGDEGWQVHIVLADYIQVKHIRREQSIDKGGNTKNHWEFKWEVALSFDKQMQELTHTQLRITELALSDTMDKDMEDKLKTTLMNGNLIVM